MPKVRMGVIGCGVIGSRHVESAARCPSIDLVAVADLREDLAKATAAKYGVPKVYTDGEALLEDGEIDAVVLAMPAFVRTELALKAFANGKHVLTEKPVAMNATEVEQMIAAKGELVAGCCSSRFRFYPSADFVTEFITEGNLGGIRVVRCRAIRPGNPPGDTKPPEWRLKKALNGGGILANWGCYDLDYLLGITGWSLRPKRVLGRTWRVPGRFQAQAASDSDAETHLAALVDCEDGTVIHYERGEMVAARAELAWNIVGDEGSLELDMVQRGDKEVVFNRATAEGAVETETIYQETADLNMHHRGPTEDFAEAILEGRGPKTGLEQALIVQRMTDAIYRSAEEGKAVEIGK